MRWVAVAGEAMAVMAVVLVVLCRYGVTDDPSNGDDQDCDDPTRRAHHLYRRDAQGRHPRDTRTSTPPGHGIPPGHGTTPDTNTTIDSKLDHETGSHDTSLGPEHKTTSNADFETTLGPVHGSPFGSDHDGTEDPELDLKTRDHDAVVDPKKTTLDPDHEDTDSDHATTPDPVYEPLDTTLDPDLFDLDHDTTSDPDEDSGSDSLHTTIDPSPATTIDSDHEPTNDETTPDPNVSLARQGTRGVKVPPPVGADDKPMRYSGMGARRGRNPKPPGLVPK